MCKTSGCTVHNSSRIFPSTNNNTMEQLAFIVQDEVNCKPILIEYNSIQNTYLLLESETNRLENEGLMWVDEHKIDTHTIVRNFASEQDGLVCS